MFVINNNGYEQSVCALSLRRLYQSPVFQLGLSIHIGSLEGYGKAMDKYKQSPDTFKHQLSKLIIQTIQNGDMLGLYGWCISAIFEQDSDIPAIEMRVTGDNYAGNVLITYDAKTHTCDCLFIGREYIKNVPFSNLYDVLDCEIRRGDLTIEEYENKILAHS